MQSPVSLLALFLACLLAAGCSSGSGSSAGTGFSSGSESPAGPRRSALVLATPEGATWKDPATGERQPLKAGMTLPEGATVKSAGQKGVTLRLPGGGGTLTLDSRTRITLARLDEEGPMEVLVTQGRVDGEVAAGTLTLMNACGGVLSLSPRTGASAPYSFGDTLPEELWDTVIGLGLDPGMLQSPHASKGPLEQVSQVFIAPVRTPIAIPEPTPVALALIGGMTVTAVLRGRRTGSGSRPG